MHGVPSACCHISCNDMRILCPISEDSRPWYRYTCSIWLMLLSSGSDLCLCLSTNVCRHIKGLLRHRDSHHHEGELWRCVSGMISPIPVHLSESDKLLEETLDAGGRPLTTSANALRDIVLPPSLLTKLLSVAGANASFNTGIGGPFSSPIPWRKTNVRHNANEIYFDMVEELNAIVNKYYRFSSLLIQWISH